MHAVNAHINTNRRKHGLDTGTVLFMLTWCQWTCTREEHCFSHLTHSHTNTHNPSAVITAHFRSSSASSHTYTHTHPRMLMQTWTHQCVQRPWSKRFVGVQPRKPDVSSVGWVYCSACMCVSVRACVLTYKHTPDHCQDSRITRHLPQKRLKTHLFRLHLDPSWHDSLPPHVRTYCTFRCECMLKCFHKS